MSQKKEKIGEGTLNGMARQGLAELRGAMYVNSNVAQPTQYGIYGVMTQSEIVDAKKDRELDRELDRD